MSDLDVRELTMAEATHIARLKHGSDAEIALEYGVEEDVVAQIRKTKGYKGANLR